jgi:hypothetical protein
MNSVEKIIIQQYLSGQQPFEYLDTNRYSTLVAGLRDCRINSKRKVEDGKYDPEIKHGDEGNWLACIGYFTVLDQIGSCFKPLGELEPAINYKSIKFAIEKFGFDLIDNNEKQLHALIALRNAFTHDFNLLNIPENSRLYDLQRHKFTVKARIESWIVKLPKEPWDGNIDEKDFFKTSDTTFVNLFAFGQLVESIYKRICDLHSENKLELRLPTKTLINKYTFITSDHPINK